jgi:hypothetical protein
MHFPVKTALHRAFLLTSLSNSALLAHAQEFAPPAVGKSVETGLKCPANPDGEIELVYRSTEDQSTAHISVTYEGHKPIRVVYKSAKYDRDIDLKTETRTEYMDFARRIIGVSTPIRDRICNGTKASRNRYFSQLDVNRARFPSP